MSFEIGYTGDVTVIFMLAAEIMLSRIASY
jgi:hypothetical protein